MTTSSLTLHEGAGIWKSAWHTIVVVPFYAVRKWLALFLITSGTLYASAMFNMQHSVFPWWVAFPLAIGIEWTYLSGLAYATELRKSGWSNWMIGAGALTSGLYGVLYIVGHYEAIPARPTGAQALALAFAHVVPLIALLLLYTLCKRDFMAEQRQYTDRQRQREETWRDEQLEIEIEKQRLDLERKRLLLTRAQRRADNVSAPVSNVSSTDAATVSRHQVAQLAQKYRVSERTIWRWIRDSKLSAADINMTAEEE